MGCHLSKVTVQAVDQSSKVAVQADDQKIMIGRVVGDPLNMSLSDINDDEVSALDFITSSYRSSSTTAGSSSTDLYSTLPHNICIKTLPQ